MEHVRPTVGVGWGKAQLQNLVNSHFSPGNTRQLEKGSVSLYTALPSVAAIHRGGEQQLVVGAMTDETYLAKHLVDFHVFSCIKLSWFRQIFTKY